MAVFVLVPGMWHGGWCWRRVGPLLRAHGHDVHAPTLTGLGERSHIRSFEIDIGTHITDVVRVLEYEELHEVVLVGHSLAGAMVPAVATAVPDRLAHVVSLDGFLTAPGESFKDALPDRWEAFSHLARAAGDPWWAPPPSDWDFGLTGRDLQWVRTKLTPHPLRTWIDPLPIDEQRWAGLPRTFVSCAAGMSKDDVAEEEQTWLRRGWRYRPIDSVHDAMIASPELVTEALIAVVEPAP